MTDRARPIGRADIDYSPWRFAAEADDATREEQGERQAALRRLGHGIGDGCFVSPLASVDADALRLGDRSYIAAGAYVTGTVRLGSDCSVNPYAVVRGDVSAGDAVRIGAHTSILGFNHTMSDPDVPVFRQPMASRGITIGDDVWIGSHVVVLDGVDVGSRSVLAAGAVVTRDVPEGAVVGGNPARVLKHRVTALAPAADGGLGARLARFADRAREQAGDVLDRAWDAETRLFSDAPGTAPTVRAQGDAVEVADLLLRSAPPQLSAGEIIDRLRSWQDRGTGLVGRLLPDGSVSRPLSGLFDPDAGYHVLSTGYALDILGSSFAHPTAVVAEAGAEDVIAGLGRQPWAERTWSAGDWIDILGTAMHWNRRMGVEGRPGAREALIGWMLSAVHADSGMWGSARAEDGLLQLVNGYYRASRGTFAQFGLPVPYPERVVDTVLRHVRDGRFFRRENRNACNVLDVAHPLWLTRGSGHRGDEVTEVARSLLDDALGQWVDGAGFGFRAPHPSTDGLPETAPGLQGTEMWLAIVWLLADLAGVSDALGYRPRGVHRPEPAPGATPER